MEAIGEDWTIDVSQSRPYSEVSTGYSFFEEGDILIAKVTPCFENGKAAIARGLEHSAGFGTTEITVVRPSDRLDTRFLFYALNEDGFKQLGVSEMTGAGGLKRVPDRTIKDFRLAVPGIEDQRLIAGYLDKETAEIDAFIRDQEQLIALLEERRGAAISDTVTNGLDKSAALRESGVDWLGRIPAHWSVQSGRRVFSQRRELARRADEQLAASQEFGVIPQTLYMERSGNRVTVVQKGFEILKHVEPGDFVISMRSFQGGLEYSTYRGKMSSAYVMIKAAVPVEPRFYRYVFKSVPYISALRSTSNLVRDGQAMRYSNFAQVQIPRPPIEEQRSIADYLDFEIAEIDSAVADARTAIDLLRERRVAIISAAVTGQMDVLGSAKG